MWSDVLMARPVPPWVSASQAVLSRTAEAFPVVLAFLLPLAVEPFKALHFMSKAHLDVDSFKACLTH